MVRVRDPYTAIQLDGLSKRFGTFQAVWPITLRIPYGTVFGYLGTNGAGKTTTIRLMTGLLRPTTGCVRLCGWDLSADYIEARRTFAYIPDQSYLYPKMTGREFLAFVFSVHFNRPPDARAIDGVIERVGLNGWGDELIEQYSHGMRQRLLFASALLRDPPIWIIDEPIIGLDPKGVRHVKQWIREKARRGGTVFLSTHLLHIAQEICDRVGIIHRGRLIAVGTVDELLRQVEVERPDLEEIFLRLTEETRMTGVAPH